MEDLKREIELKIIGNMLIEWCRQKSENVDSFLFNPALSTQTRCIRFSTKNIESLFKVSDNGSGCWKNGHHSFYEILNGDEEFIVQLSISMIGLATLEKKRLNTLLSKYSPDVWYDNKKVIVKKWMLDPKQKDRVLMIEDLYSSIIEFEKELLNISNEEYNEGNIKELYTNVYERNSEARKKCIEIHGTKCKICGFSFGEVYGEEFKGKIEVHHIVPLHMIKKNYIVDPINDLIPVCPNCHMVLHSKKDGVYTPEEIINLLGKNKRNNN